MNYKSDSSTIRCKFRTQRKGKSTKFEYEVTPDTGTTKTIIPKRVMDKYQMPYKKNYNYSIRDASGNKMRCEGIALIWIKPEGGENTLIEALVSSTLTDDLLSEYLFDLGAANSAFQL